MSVDALMLAGVEGVHTISSDSREQEVVFFSCGQELTQNLPEHHV